MHFWENDKQALQLIIDHHYSHRLSSNIQYIGAIYSDGGLFGDRGEPVAVCVFSIPPTRWRLTVWELSRLVKAPGVDFQLTALISKCCKRIKSQIDLVVSFADFTQLHHGGIYQAASWNFHEMRKPKRDGVLIDGVFVPGRSCNSRWGTNSPTKLAEILPDSEVVPHYDEGKYLYWRALKKSGKIKAKKLGLASNPYPKPDMKDIKSQ